MKIHRGKYNFILFKLKMWKSQSKFDFGKNSDTFQNIYRISRLIDLIIITRKSNNFLEHF